MKVAAVIIAVVLVFGALFAAICIDIVPTGHTGVFIHYGQVQQEPVQSGKLIFHQLLVDKVAFVDNRQRDVTAAERIWGETNDATPVYAEGVHITYQIPADKSVWIYTNVADYEKNLITWGVVASATKSALVELSPKDSTNRAKVEPLVKQKLTEAMNDKYGEGVVVIKKVTIDQMDFEDVYNQAIQAKSIAAQQAEQQKIANQVAIEKAEAEKKIAAIETEKEIEVKRKRTEADAELEKINTQTKAEQTKITAEAEAERIRITAEAQAKANKLISESLNELMLEYEKISKWNGVLPTTVSTGSGFMLEHMLK